MLSLPEPQPTSAAASLAAASSGLQPGIDDARPSRIDDAITMPTEPLAAAHLISRGNGASLVTELPQPGGTTSRGNVIADEAENTSPAAMEAASDAAEPAAAADNVRPPEGEAGGHMQTAGSSHVAQGSAVQEIGSLQSAAPSSEAADPTEAAAAGNTPAQEAVEQSALPIQVSAGEVRIQINTQGH